MKRKYKIKRTASICRPYILLVKRGWWIFGFYSYVGRFTTREEAFKFANVFKPGPWKSPVPDKFEVE